MKATYIRTQAVAEASIIQQAFSWMFGGLLVTAMTAMIGSGSIALQQALVTNPILGIGLLLAELGIVFYLSARVTQLSKSTAIGLFLLYAALNGVTFSTLFLIYTGASIWAAFVSSSLVFGVMACFGYVTKKDLSGMGSLAMMALIGVIIASLVNMFVHSGALSFGLSYLCVLIFVGLTAWDTQQLKRMSQQMSGGNLGIYGALRLYLDFINLFLSLLRIFGDRRN